MYCWLCPCIQHSPQKIRTYHILLLLFSYPPRTAQENTTCQGSATTSWTLPGEHYMPRISYNLLDFARRTLHAKDQLQPPGLCQENTTCQGSATTSWTLPGEHYLPRISYNLLDFARRTLPAKDQLQPPGLCQENTTCQGSATTSWTLPGARVNSWTKRQSFNELKNPIIKW